MNKSILIVDSDSQTGKLLKEMLEIFSYDSIRVENGTDALKKLNTNKFSMIIINPLIPNIGALETLKKVKEKYPEIPVILVSDDSIQESLKNNQLLKPNGFLTKPFMMTDIENLLCDLL